MGDLGILCPGFLPAQWWPQRPKNQLYPVSRAYTALGSSRWSQAQLSHENTPPPPVAVVPRNPGLSSLLHLGHSLKQGWSSNHSFRSSFSSHELSGCKQQLGSVYSWSLPLIRHDLYPTHNYTCHPPTGYQEHWALPCQGWSLGLYTSSSIPSQTLLFL